MKKLTLSTIVVLAMSSFAMAGGDIAPVEPAVEVPAPVVDNDSGFYIGGGISALSWTEKGPYSGVGEQMFIDADWEATWTGGTILAGYKYNKYLAIEGRYTTSFGDASWEDHGVDAGDDGSEIDNIALYIKPMYPIEKFSLYALLGYGETTLTYDGSPDFSESGFQWGIGANYEFTEQISAFIDYTEFYDDTGFDTLISDLDYNADSITFGVVYKF